MGDVGMEKELIPLLRDHLDRYPKMQPQDVVKLLYQREFGPGHLIADPQKALDYLKEEYATVEQNDSTPLTEDIGNGLVRIYLSAMDKAGVSLEEVAEAFFRCANAVQGDRERFLQTLQVFREAYRTLPYAFSEEELADYLEDYISKGCPMVSHSELYRKLYHPAYRVISSRDF